ncbi:LAMI_0H10858g1_1 [Lachancea mirantina]|uniref:S-formylglutathione hydrolase n=1 Tax=Lachancea mirantina TaxID=1230905 RepID=A0A1G4KGY0_9SACH|nr:LAMI_0H10858g1_1 [Lachancea mirantina]
MSFESNGEIACCGGKLLKLSHKSNEIGSHMDVNIYLPKQYYNGDGNPIPVIYFLSGLTCTPQNASEKAFWQIQADNYGFSIVFPDTSPRGDEIPDDKDQSYDFGLGAGFYVDATEKPFADHYRMFSYIHEELPHALDKFFNRDAKKLEFVHNTGITGHSMGGYGALTGFLKYYGKDRYVSCSAFAPIVNPSQVPWGQKAFTGYLGHDKELWKQHDPSYIIKNVDNTTGSEILIHQGSSDPFLEKQLRPDLLLEAVKGTSWENKIKVNVVDGFDHSYYFVSSFVPQHAAFHAKNLGLI